MGNNSALREPGSILVIRRDNIGDLVCTTPLLAALRKRFPLAWIGVLANSYNCAILDENPDVDAVYAYQKLKHLRVGTGSLSALAQKARLMWKLRRMKLDLVVIAAGPLDQRGARLAAILGARRTLFSDPYANGQHEVERCFTAARALGMEGPIPPLQVVPERYAVGRARRAIEAAGFAPARPIVGFHVSARRPAQRWPAGRFAELARAIDTEHGAGTMLFWAPGSENQLGHPGDDGKAATILELSAGNASLIAWPTAELTQLVAGLAACDAVVCSDGGAMHIAAALGKPILCFFGDSPADRWKPWGARHIVLQPASRKVEDISVEEALISLSLLLRGTEPQGPPDASTGNSVSPMC